MRIERRIVYMVLTAVTLISHNVLAQDVTECHFNGHGEPCQASEDCQYNDSAKACVDGTCQIPCQIEVDGDLIREPFLCGMGESCVFGMSDLGPAYYCQSSKFAMDLNLLDSCIMHFVEDIRPNFAANSCSLEWQIVSLLDQNSDRQFNIYDLDACILSFLEDEPCDPDIQSCEDNQVYCDDQSDCGWGLFCNQDMHRCERECGFVSSRDQKDYSTIERQCSGNLTYCDYDYGKCRKVDQEELKKLTCQVDSECPSGAYCLLGKCAKKCYRNIECPGADWYCSKTNTCIPRPKATAEDQTEDFDPKEYSVLFATKDITLDSINNSYDIPLLIMSMKSKKQIFDDPSVVFGYRLEIKYERKQSAKCLGDLTKLSSEEAADCIINSDEEFITLDNPFGTVYAMGDPSVAISLNDGIVEKHLTPGSYEATIRAIFNNGGSTTTRVKFVKTSPSGDYFGRLSIYVDGFKQDGVFKNVLANTNMAMKLHVDTNSDQVTWDDFLRAHNLYTDKKYDDITQGYPVTGYIRGDENMVFNQASQIASGKVEGNIIPVKGIYSKHLGRMRLMSVIEVRKEYCSKQDAGKTCDDPAEFAVKNPFGRKIRRLIQFIGPFDTQQRMFHGIYRETISGLLPNDLTLDGGFRLKQTAHDESPIEGLPAKLVGNHYNYAVGFDTVESLLEDVEKEIEASCKEYVGDFPVLRPETDNFETPTSYQGYLASAYTQEQLILNNLTSFETRVQNAYNTMKSTGVGQNAYLTLNEFFKGTVEFCEEGDDENCVDQKSLKCGLALYRKALLSNFINTGSIPNGTPYTLFCHQSAAKPEDCEIPPWEEPELTTVREYTRFYGELTQTHVFQANNSLSDAFYVLYKNADNSGGLGSDSAFNYKKDALLESIRNYDSARKEFLSPEAASVLYNLPMTRFSGMGDSWIKQMHSVVNDRMEAILELVDLKRRVIKDKETSDFDFAQSLMHMEYLSQVYLIALQKHWQGSQFQYTGTGPEMMERGNQLLAKVSDTRNPLGLHENRVYFENGDLSLTNWENYQKSVLEEIENVRTTISTAIGEMKGSLADKDTFESTLLASQQNFEAEIEELCGSNQPLPAACDLTLEEEKIVRDCKGEDCPYEYNCEDETCDQVYQAWSDATTGSALNESACRIDVPGYEIRVHGKSRACARGQMGVLLQEKATLEMQRENTVNQVKALMRQIARQQKYLSDTQSSNEDLNKYLIKQNAELTTMEAALVQADAAFQGAKAFADGIDCLVILGMAAGTNCPQKIAKAAVVGAATTAFFSVKGSVQTAMGSMQRYKEQKYQEKSASAEVRQIRLTIDNMVTEVEGLVFEYEALVRQLHNISVRVKDMELKVKSAIGRQEENTENIIDRLLGRENGSVLRQNGMVQKSDQHFRQLLIETYKMAVAFIHRYNLKSDDRNLVQKIYQAVTLQDVETIAEEMKDVADDYCGANGLDCDYVHNPNVLKFSVREQLFPALTNIVDSKTGKVLTAGQQFHNIITSSQFLQKRQRLDGVTSQIEIPFTVWLSKKGQSVPPGQRWLAAGDECNHIIVAKTTGGTAGTIAVNVIGSRLEETVKYKLMRGNTDYIRSCDEVQNGQMKINTYIAGYAPQHRYGALDVQPDFFTKSEAYPACMNENNFDDLSRVHLVDYCFKYFARDRSLGAPDWKIVLPYIEDDQAWILGEGLPSDDQPVIEDVVVYFRYGSRPISE